MNSKCFGYLGPSWSILGASWDVVRGKTVRGVLGRLSGPLRAVLGRLGTVLGHLGDVVGGKTVQGVLGRLSRPLRAVLGRLETFSGCLGGVLGTFWDVLGRKTVKKPSWNCFGAVLEASWTRLGDVLGSLGSVLGASCGPLRSFLRRFVRLLGHLRASWRPLMRDFHTKRYLHIILASEMPILH